MKEIYIIFVIVFISKCTTERSTIRSNNENKQSDYSEFREKYDFIIIGGGSAGCVIANRLSENQKWSILLLEAGKTENWLTDVPILAPALMRTNFSWGYKTEEQKNMYWGYENSNVIVPRGKVLGGSSVINFMVYTRGNRINWDRIANAGNPGWSYEEVVPYFMKSERESLKYSHNKSYHNKEGLLSVEHSSYETKLRSTFLEGGKKLGHSIIDYNADERIGFAYVQANTLHGRRHSAAKAFLSPFKNRKNLQIVTQARVTKINIDPKTKRAKSVDFVHNRRQHTIKTKKEIILSAGTIASPQLLMLSGVGPEEHLRKMDIPVIQNLQVGANVHDHVGFLGMIYFANVSGITNSINPFDIVSLNRWMFNGEGPMSVPGGVEGIAFVKTNSSEETVDHPDIEIALWSSSIPHQNARVGLGISRYFYDYVFGDITGKESFQIVPLLLHPRSRGRIYLKDNNPFHWPRISYDYFSDERDLRTMISGIRYVRKLAKTEPFRRIGARLYKKKYPACEAHNFGTDGYWECALRSLAQPLQHHGGSCRMGPVTDVEAVVDHELKVYGVKGLRVGDVSVLPQPLAAHTHAPAVMIGEKLADMVKADWGRRW